jgi:adhesin transport system outer membrane protein
MKRNSMLLAVIAFFNLIPLHSQDLYDLNRCITTGLERNFSLLIARNQEEISNNNYTAGNAGFLPTLDLTSRYGGSLSANDQTLSTGEESSSSGIHNTTGNATATLGWTIFQGFNVQTTYKKLNELKQVGELNTKMAVENLVADIVSEYYLYIQQIKLYQNLAYAVLLSSERVRIDEERYLLGAASKLQLLQSRVYLNTDSSRLSRQNEVLRTSQVRLSELMALPELGADIQLKDSMIYIITNLVYEQLLEETFKSNTSLLIAASNRNISQFDYRIIASRTYPYLNFSSGYSFTYNDYGAGTLSNQQSRGPNYGLTLGVNLFDGFNRHREKSNALIDIENRQHQYEEIEQQVRADLITIYYAYTNNLLLLKLEEQNLKTAEENLDIALERYKLGSLSGLELREVQKSLLDAEERLISVEYLTKLAEISLLQISGRIMEYLTPGTL